MSTFRKILINNLECFIDVNNANGDVLFHWIINNVYKYHDVRLMNIDVKRQRMEYESAKISNEIVDLNGFDYSQNIPDYSVIIRKVISTQHIKQIVEIDLYSILSEMIVQNSVVATQGAAAIEQIWRTEIDWVDQVQEDIVFATDLPITFIPIDPVLELFGPIEIRQPFFMDIIVTSPSTVDSTDGSISITNQWGGPSPYQYRIQEGSFGTSGLTSTWQSSPLFGNLPSGLYSVQMKDSQNDESLVREVEILASLIPETPTALNATSITTASYQANWTEVTTVDSYDIETRLLDDTFVSIENALAPTSSLIITGLTTSTDYKYVVRAILDFEQSQDSNQITVTTL